MCYKIKKKRLFILYTVSCFLFCLQQHKRKRLKLIQKHKICIGKRNFYSIFLAHFKPNQFFVGFDFVSSRLGSAYKSNAIKQDSYLLSASWHFNKTNLIISVTRLNAGYSMLIMRKLFKDIPNTAVLFHQK
jgi:hypothetical protein